jgi:hypothetical protein
VPREGKPVTGRIARGVAALGDIFKDSMWVDRVTIKYAVRTKNAADRRSIEYGSSAVTIGVCRNDSLHHIDERGLLPFAQITKRGAVRSPGRGLDFCQKRRSSRGQFAEPRAAVLIIDGSLHKIAGGQSLQRAGRRRPIQRDIGRQRGLIGGFPHRKRGKQAVLQRCDLEFAARFLEQRDVDLMQPPDQKSRPL